MKFMIPRRFASALMVTLLAGVFAGPACIDRGDGPTGVLFPGVTPVSYDYSAFDTQGILLVKGIMTLSSPDSSSVAGTWNLKAVTSNDKVGPQVGTGTLQGSITGTTISLGLNPGWADNNVVLNGTLDEKGFSGTWSWITFVGPTSGGKFVAIRKT